MRLVLVAAGSIILLAGIFWPWISRLPFGKLPGDILITRPGFTLFFPITTMVIVSAVVTFLMWIIKKFGG